jgi:pimeloyl-ACP methyl ester carboxylesterase
MYFSTNGARHYYIDVGPPSSPTIVLIHGFPFSHAMWQPQIEALKNRYRVVAYDLRGQGRSEVGDGQYTLELLVDDLITLLDHVRTERATLCGLSMGGYVALRTIERNTDRVGALILCDTTSQADSNEAKLRRASSIKAIKTNGVKAYGEGFLKGAMAPSGLEDRNTSYMAESLIYPNQALGLCGTLLALAGRTDTTSFLPKIQVPTLIMVGESDTITPPDLSGKMHSLILNSELHVISHAGHLSNLENSGEFNHHLLTFLHNHVKS